MFLKGVRYEQKTPQQTTVFVYMLVATVVEDFGKSQDFKAVNHVL